MILGKLRGSRIEWRVAGMVLMMRQKPERLTGDTFTQGLLVAKTLQHCAAQLLVAVIQSQQ